MDYNDAFFHLMEAVEEKDINRIRQYAQQALESARILKQPHLEINVLCTAATGFLAASQLPTALKIYEEAAKIAKNAASDEANKDLYEQLGIQIMLYKGSALLTQKTPQYDTIIEAYQQTADRLHQLTTEKVNPESADWTNGGILHLYLFESLRILGHCHEQLGRQRAALGHYVRAVTTAEKTAVDIRKSLALKLVGTALLNLCRKLSMKNEYFIVIDKMNGLLGIGWEKAETEPKAAK